MTKNLFIGFLPKEIIIPGVVRKDELHSKSSFSFPLLFSSWAIDSIKRLVFFGDLFPVLWWPFALTTGGVAKPSYNHDKFGALEKKVNRLS